MEEILHIVNEMSPFLLLGFLLAGIMHAFIPGKFYTKYLAKPNMASVFRATLIGIPLPLCSCGVIPTAMGMRKDGASKGAVASFLICTPQTGIDSIIATLSLMGLPFAIVRPIAACLTGIFSGFLVNTFDKNPEGEARNDVKEEEHHDNRSFSEKIREALEYSMIEMMEDIGKWLVVGLVIAGLITAFVPDSFFMAFEGNTWASMLLVMVIVLPMYLCATGSIPIAVALIMKGLTPGAGMLLLMVGPACNLASMLIVRKVMGTRTLVAYLAAIVIGSIGFGYFIDYLHFSGLVDFTSSIMAVGDCCEEHTSWFTWTCTGILTLLLINALVLPKLGLRKAHHCHCHEHDHEHGDDCCCHEHNHEQGDDSCCHEGQKKVYHIGGMNCNHCRAAAEKALREVSGVEDVTVDLASREAHIKGNASEDSLRKAVEAIGFTLEK